MVPGAIERGSQVRLYAGVTAVALFHLDETCRETTAIKTGDLPAYNGIADSNTRLGQRRCVIEFSAWLLKCRLTSESIDESKVGHEAYSA